MEQKTAGSYPVNHPNTPLAKLDTALDYGSGDLSVRLAQGVLKINLEIVNICRIFALLIINKQKMQTINIIMIGVEADRKSGSGESC